MAFTGHTLRDIIAGQGIEILDRGHSVSRGNFNIRCPMCGAADQGHHMGIRLDNGWWGCWRNAEHRGKSPVRLLVALTGKPVWQIRDMLGLHTAPLLETFSSVKARLTGQGMPQAPVTSKPTGIAFPKEFRTSWFGSRAASRFTAYMADRGFEGSTLAQVVDRYTLAYAITGTFADRVVFPYLYRGEIVTWTARTIHPDARLRYRDLEQEESAVHKDQMLYNYDGAARGGKALLVVEGPVDVLKGDWAGQLHGVRCVGLSTNSMTDGQLVLLAELAEAFDRVYIGLDTPTRFAKMDSYRLVGKIRSVVDVETFDSSSLGKDLGGASLREVSNLLRRLTT